MGVLGTVLLVFFIITAVLLVLLVLVQDEEGDSLGGIFAGGSSSAFGSRSGNILTRATSVLGALFLILSFGLALANKTRGASGVEKAGSELSTEQSGESWVDKETGAVPADGQASPATESPVSEQKTDNGESVTEEEALEDSSETETPTNGQESE